MEGDARESDERIRDGPDREPSDPGSDGRPTSRVRTLAFGVIVDPNISQPLPFAGTQLSRLQSVRHGTQFNGFFGGSYGQLAFSVPSIRGSRWQLAGRAFGIASSYNDRAFVGGREQYERNVRQRPAAASVWLVRPLTARLALRIGYDLDYTALARSERPVSVVRDPGRPAGAWSARGADWPAGRLEGAAWWVGSRRTGWRAWGAAGPDDYRPSDA